MEYSKSNADYCPGHLRKTCPCISSRFSPTCFPIPQKRPMSEQETGHILEHLRQAWQDGAAFIQENPQFHLCSLDTLRRLAVEQYTLVPAMSGGATGMTEQDAVNNCRLVMCARGADADPTVCNSLRGLLNGYDRLKAQAVSPRPDAGREEREHALASVLNDVIGFLAEGGQISGVEHGDLATTLRRAFPELFREKYPHSFPSPTSTGTAD